MSFTGKEKRGENGKSDLIYCIKRKQLYVVKIIAHISLKIADFYLK